MTQATDVKQRSAAVRATKRKSYRKRSGLKTHVVRPRTLKFGYCYRMLPPTKAKLTEVLQERSHDLYVMPYAASCGMSEGLGCVVQVVGNDFRILQPELQIVASQLKQGVLTRQSLEFSVSSLVDIDFRDGDAMDLWYQEHEAMAKVLEKQEKEGKSEVFSEVA